jgi:hypothetical protein
MPCVLGSEDSIAGDIWKSLNIRVNPFQETLYEDIKELKIANRLILTQCSGV